MLGAIADASGHDPDAEATYRGLIERFVDATADRIERDIEAGLIAPPLDATEAARALVWMSERYLKETLGRLPQTPVAKVTETLPEIWTRALYGAGSGDPA